MTPLHVAAERAHNDIMEVLQKHGAKVHTCMCLRVPSERQHTHLHTWHLASLSTSSHSIAYLKGIVYWKIVNVYLPTGHLYSGKKEEISGIFSLVI